MLRRHVPKKEISIVKKGIVKMFVYGAHRTLKAFSGNFWAKLEQEANTL